MNTAIRQQERQVERSLATKAEADKRNKVGRVLKDLQNAGHEDSLAEKVEDSLFEELTPTDEQEFLHEFGGGVSKGPPRGGWPMFHPVTGKRLASQQVSISLSPH
jgi:hypothetical protein